MHIFICNVLNVEVGESQRQARLELEYGERRSWPLPHMAKNLSFKFFYTVQLGARFVIYMRITWTKNFIIARGGARTLNLEISA